MIATVTSYHGVYAGWLATDRLLPVVVSRPLSDVPSLGQFDAIRRHGRGIPLALGRPIPPAPRPTRDARIAVPECVVVKPTSSSSFVVVALVLAACLPAAAAQLASKEDAVVSATASGWVVSNALVTYGVGFDANGDLVAQDLRRTGQSRSE